MKLSKYISIGVLFLGVSALVCVVVVDKPTIFDYVNTLYKKAQALQNEFPELTQINSCEEYQHFIERGRPVYPFGESNPQADKAWIYQKDRLQLLCNFEIMWLKIQDAMRNPSTTSEPYIATLTTTLVTWEVAWRSLIR